MDQVIHTRFLWHGRHVYGIRDGCIEPIGTGLGLDEDIGMGDD
jgi:hypothetical protein